MVINLAHIGETALLLLAAYLLGCVAGYAVRRILYAARGTHQATVAGAPAARPGEPAPELRRPRSYAARLAASVEDMPVDPPNVIRLHPQRAPASATPATPPMRHPPHAGNLKQIKGIGPKIEAALNARGVFHMHQVAAWSQADVEQIDTELGLKGRILRERWVQQARDMVQARA